VKILGAAILAAALAAGGAWAAVSLRDPETKTVTVTMPVTTTVESTTTVADGTLPTAVETTRAAIAAAAEARDVGALRQLIPKAGFTYSYGGPYPGGAIAYWEHLEKTSRERPFETLARIMRLPYSLRQGLYVWPFAYGTAKGELTEYERGLLGDLVTSYVGEDYYGWRSGIRPDGAWVFFVSGD
jgi:hypothetical protein